VKTVKSVFISDCEGPISKNDNAYEIATKFIPNGNNFFCNISKYDDILADILNKPKYTAGSTLQLILPFLKAYDVTDQQMEKFSTDNIMLISGTQVMLNHIETIADRYIISTSYEHYIKALCKTVNFPYKNTHCTKTSLDKATISLQEKEQLRETAQTISQMHLITIPTNAKNLEDFNLKDQALIKRFDEIFWKEIPQMSVYNFFSDVITIGGKQKAKAVCDIVKQLEAPFNTVIYVGDSITDAEALNLVKKHGGLAISFNGNSYAVKNADIAVLSENNLVTAIIADIFYRLGKEKTLKIVKQWSKSSLETVGVEPELLNQAGKYSKTGPKVQIVTRENMNSIVTESSEFRKDIRGVAIGRLG